MANQLLKTGILGVGNMGNMVAARANTLKSMPVLGLNTSERDIDAVKSSTAIECIYLGTGDGAGKDRSKSKEAMKASIKEVIGDDKFKAFVDECDVIFIVSSTGGGTGSGICPMFADIMKNLYQDKIIILVGALPTIGESVGAQRNTIEYIAEATRLELPFMLFDNQNTGKKSTNDTFEIVNDAVVQAVSVIRGDFNNLSKYGMIDTGDMTKLITLPGLIYINVLEGIYPEKISADGSIEDLIIDSMKNNVMVTMDRDKFIKRRGYIVNLSDGVQPFFNKDFPKLTELYGEPIEVFDHYAVNEDGDENNFAVIIQSGMSLPENRLKAIKNRIDEAAAMMAKAQKPNSILESLTEDVSVYDITKEGGKASKSKFDMESLDSIMGKY